MTYSRYVSKVSSAITNLKNKKDDVKGVDLDSSWEGMAHDKQVSNRDELNSSLTSVISDMESLVKAMQEIDQYDNFKTQLEKWENEYNSIPVEEKDRKDSALGNLNAARSGYNEKKGAVQDALAAISTSYSSSLSLCMKTSVVSTNEAFIGFFAEQGNVATAFDVAQYVQVNKSATNGVNLSSSTFVNQGGTTSFNSGGSTTRGQSSVTGSSTTANNRVTNDTSSVGQSTTTYSTSNSSSTSGSGNMNGNPDFSNKEAWVTANPYSQAGLYGQCTWFAWGRFYEAYGYDPGFRGNGNVCAQQLVNAHPDKFTLSSTPVSGAVFSYKGYPYGHTGFVTEVKDGMMTIQDGNYDGVTNTFAVAQHDWGTRTMSVQDFINKYGGKVEFANPI